MPAIDRLFTVGVLERLARLQRPEAARNGRDIAERHRILTAGGANGRAGERALLAPWTDFVEAGELCGLLDGDVIARLTSDNDDDFRSALSECEAAWFLRERMHAEVHPRPDPPNARGVDLLAVREQREIYVEVKAPYVPLPPLQGNPPVTHWAGDDAGTLVRCIRDAAGQFREGRANLVFLVPILRNQLFHDRGQLLKATIGEPVWVVPVSLTDAPASPSYIDFKQNGRLARWYRDSDGSFFTQHTRVSAVMSLEHRWRELEDESIEIHYSVVVVHNPFAAVPIDPLFFGNAPQWIRTGETMGWNDDYRGP